MRQPQWNIEQQVLLCQQVARLARAKLPLIGELARSTRHLSPRVADSAEAVEAQVAAGQSLSSALAGGNSRDARILAACIEAGERSNSLDQTLELWAGMHIANSKSSKTMRAALVYPLLLIAVTLLSLGVVIWKIIPEYRSTYVMFHHEMPRWLTAIVWVREQLGPLMILLLTLMLLPLAIWWWRRRSFDARGMPREPVRRQRLEAFASNIAGYTLTGSLPLSEVVSLSTRVMGAQAGDTEQSFERLRHQQPIVPLPRETSMLLASLHAGLIDRNETVKQLHAVAMHLRQSADVIATRQARWLPMMIALVVGGLTILTYVFLIYLPWIVLMTKIVEQEAWGP